MQEDGSASANNINQHNDSDKENVMPEPALKEPQKGKSVFRRIKSVSLEENPRLFEGLFFYLDIFTNGEKAGSYFTKSVIDHGGKISSRLGKHITHLVWSEGRAKTLSKALEFEGIKIISTLWFQESLNEQKLADEADYKPVALAKMIDKKMTSHEDIHDLNRGMQRSTMLNKKRTHADLN